MSEREARGGMQHVCRVLAAIGIMCGLAACSTVTTIPMEPQSKQRDSRHAPLYFIWPRSAMLRTATFDIKGDGQVVGKIAPDSYFDWTYFKTDVQVAAGRTYYYAINVKAAYAPIIAGL